MIDRRSMIYLAGSFISVGSLLGIPEAKADGVDAPKKKPRAVGGDSCGSCKFFNSSALLCQRYPAEEKKAASDWCGEYNRGTGPFNQWGKK